MLLKFKTQREALLIPLHLSKHPNNRISFVPKTQHTVQTDSLAWPPHTYQARSSVAEGPQVMAVATLEARLLQHQHNADDPVRRFQTALSNVVRRALVS